MDNVTDTATTTTARATMLLTSTGWSHLVFVVIGHWIAAALTYSDGGFWRENPLVDMPWTQWLTWIFQVVPVVLRGGRLRERGVVDPAHLRRVQAGVAAAATGPPLGPTVVTSCSPFWSWRSSAGSGWGWRARSSTSAPGRWQCTVVPGHLRGGGRADPGRRGPHTGGGVNGGCRSG